MSASAVQPGRVPWEMLRHDMTIPSAGLFPTTTARGEPTPPSLELGWVATHSGAGVCGSLVCGVEHVTHGSLNKVSSSDTCSAVYSLASRAEFSRLVFEWVMNMTNEERMRILVLALKCQSVSYIRGDYSGYGFQFDVERSATLALHLLYCELGVAGAAEGFASVVSALLYRFWTPMSINVFVKSLDTVRTHEDDDKHYIISHIDHGYEGIPCGREHAKCVRKAEHEARQAELQQTLRRAVDAARAETPRVLLPFMPAVSEEEFADLLRQSEQASRVTLNADAADGAQPPDARVWQLAARRLYEHLQQSGRLTPAAEAVFRVFVACKQACYVRHYPRYLVRLRAPEFGLGLVEPGVAEVNMDVVALLMLAMNLMRPDTRELRERYTEAANNVLRISKAAYEAAKLVSLTPGRGAAPPLLAPALREYQEAVAAVAHSLVCSAKPEAEAEAEDSAPEDSSDTEDETPSRGKRAAAAAAGRVTRSRAAAAERATRSRSRTAAAATGRATRSR